MSLRRNFINLLSQFKAKYIIPLVILTYIGCDYTGVFLHLYELDYYKHFTYPLEGDFHHWISMLKKGERPSVTPINAHDYLITKNAKGKCVESDGARQIQIRVVYIVKSSMDHFDRRRAIRRTWGYEKRFADVNVRTVFLLGSGNPNSPDSAELQGKIDEEYREFRDLVQGDFVDSYYNNTIKAMMGLRWAAEQCPTSRFYFFADDDYYISTRNVLRFLRNPAGYPKYLEEPVLSFDDDDSDGREKKVFQSRHLKQLVDFDLPENVKLYAGFVYHSPPMRHWFSKWFVTLQEYPYHLWPPYVTAGAYALSKNALVDMYHGSYFVKLFKFDDVYLGILAKKVGIEPFHSPVFHPNRVPGNRVRDYQYVVASHGFSDPGELEMVWNQQKQAGNA